MLRRVLVDGDHPTGAFSEGHECPHGELARRPTGREQGHDGRRGAAEEADDGAPAYGPLAQSGGIWEKGLETLVEAENRIIDCLYR